MKKSIIPTASYLVESVYEAQYNLLCNKLLETMKGVALKGGTNVCFKIKFINDSSPLVNVDELVNEFSIKGYAVTRSANEICIDWSKAEPRFTSNPYNISLQTHVTTETTVGTPEVC